MCESCNGGHAAKRELESHETPHGGQGNETYGLRQEAFQEGPCVTSLKKKKKMETLGIACLSPAHKGRGEVDVAVILYIFLKIMPSSGLLSQYLIKSLGGNPRSAWCYS